MEDKITYTLRPATIDDFDFVFSLKKDAMGDYIKQTWGWDEELQHKMQMDEFKTENISIIELNGSSAGTLGINEKDDDIFISRLYIGKKDQSKGLGTKIINDIISKFKDSSKQIKLSVLFVNHRAKKLYEILGFEVYAEENKHYKMVYNKQ